MFHKKDIFKTFSKFTGKQLCQSLFFNKVARFGPKSLSKKKLRHSLFSYGICEIFNNTLFIEYLRAILLLLQSIKQLLNEQRSTYKNTY